MALFKFAKAMLNDKPIAGYNSGEMLRDFTDAEGLVRLIAALMLTVSGDARPS